MREKTLGRWIMRLAVTIGVGTAALGLSATVAQADVALSAPRYQAVIADVTQTAARAVTPPVYVVQDWDWT
ncbi:hypothetical protein [Dactylosporangium darangshiense]|jgi:hypothetical protein|uniref:Uncharacterized protein n=1 Tax=Dactylosporangium darangshiense TaxID=579108 RepID=A0ABP8D6T2_9ACTN|nr:hypothetical protein [Dactylosporangium sp.]